ncbi:MAG: RluA family pseudouridine synthase [Anaerolineales bacterium]|nr:RluA family pseudouridine synthase [Anaerolineales bacterium]
MIDGVGDARTVTFLIDEPGERLDKVIALRLPELSRTRAQRLIEQGFVFVNGEVVCKPAFKLEAAASLTVILPTSAPTAYAAEPIPLEIVFENKDLLVVNKPAGMVVHPAAGHMSGTLVNAVLGYVSGIEGVGDEARPGIVHRLDKDTSGLIVVAKNDVANRSLQRQFAERSVEKIYLALVDGFPPTDAGRIEAAIARDPHARKRMALVSEREGGKPALTEYRVVEKFAAHSLLECRPLTGRTHQIRLHLAHVLKCPIVGDTVYGRRKPTLPLDRHFLHAVRLTLTLPRTRKRQTFIAPLPAELEQVLETLRK